MNSHDQQTAFDEDLTRLIDRYRREFNLSYADLVGVLTMRAAAIALEPIQDEEDDE